MEQRRAWHPPWYAWALLALAAFAFVAHSAAHLVHGEVRYLTIVLIVAVALLLRWLWSQPPAIAMCAAIALSIFSGGWQQMGVGGVPLDRVMLVLVLAQFVLHAPGTACVPRVRVRGVHLLLAVTLIYVLGSAVAAGTLHSEAGALSLIDQLGLMPYLMFLLAPSIFATERERGWLLGVLVALGLYLGLTAVFESLGPHALVFPRYITHVDATLPEGRAGGPFQSPVTEGFATLACAAAAAIAYPRWRGWRRAVALTAGAVCMFGCFLTLERGVWIAAAAAVVLAALVTPSGRRLLLPGAALAALVIAVALSLSPALSGRTSGRLADRDSVWDRQNQTAAGLRMVAAKPLLGFGWNRYTTDDLDYFRQAPTYPLTGVNFRERPLPLHDTYLGYAVELGLVGLTLWLAALLWGVGGAIAMRGAPELHGWRAGLVALGVFALVVALFDPQPQPFAVLVLWVWAGVVSSAQRASAPRQAVAPTGLHSHRGSLSLA